MLLVLLPFVQLQSPGDEPGCTWIQVAEEGEFRGHPTGPFVLDRAAFDTIVANFRAHPSYRCDETGKGCTDVVPFDFHHASEQGGPSVAVAGAPAQAWAQELEVRVGEDGKSQLWAYTRWLEPARTYVREGKYKWCSVAVWPDATDPKTGQRVGWYLSSIALTNDPFIQGMQPIAAARSANHPVTEKETANMELLKLLATRFNIPADEGAVQKAILAELDAAGQATAQLTSILGALGVEDVDAAMQRIVAQMKAAKALEEAMPQLAALKDEQAAVEEKAVEEDTDMAMQAHRLPAAAKAALLVMRRGNVARLTRESAPADFAARVESRKAFLAAYPPAPAADKAHLLQAVATVPAGQPITAPQGPEAGPASSLAELGGYPGRNDLERAINLVRSKTPHLPFALAHKEACRLLATARQ